MSGSCRSLNAAVLCAAAASVLAGCAANLASGPPSDAGPTFASRGEEAVREAAAAGRASGADPAKLASEGPRARAVADLAKANARSPGDTVVAMAYVRALKSSGKRTEALAVLEAAADANPAEQALSVEQGLLALELGQPAKAQGALQKAAQGMVPGTPQDWRVLSGLGIAASSQGNQKEAQRHFAKALELSPNNPVLLNNLAVSLMLDRKIDQAEAVLKRAAKAGAARQQVAQNLALAKALKTEAVQEEGQ